MKSSRNRRYVMALSGVIPAIALSAGILSLSEDSPTRQQYWPWLPLVVLGIGLAFSTFFWLVLAPRGEQREQEKGGDQAP